MVNLFESFNKLFESHQDLEEDLYILAPMLEEKSCVEVTAENVMAAYQNANKWLDTVKEMLFTDLGCVYFSSYIHNLAHSMPVRFDKFGDILHTIDLKIPYPATAYIPQEPEDIDDVFDIVFMILDNIKAALNEFIKCTDEEYHGMSCAAETLLNDIESEYVPLFKMKKSWEDYHDNMRFDKWVGQYVTNRGNLNESMSTEGPNFKEPSIKEHGQASDNKVNVIKLNDEMLNKVFEIDDSYNATPQDEKVTEKEIQDIINLGFNKEEAKNIMKRYLGFGDEDLQESMINEEESLNKKAETKAKLDDLFGLSKENI